MKNQATTNSKVKPTAKKVTAINAVTAQSGALAITVQTRKASAKQLKSCEPLATAMLAIGEETTPELLARLPKNTVAFQVFSSQALGTASLFDWFDNNPVGLTRKTKDNKVLLDIAGAYARAFGISHDKAADGPLKCYPFYKRFSNALQQWAKRKGGFDKRASGAITDAVAAYLDKKLLDNAPELSDSLVAWVLKNEDILQRIKKALETPAA